MPSAVTATPLRLNRLERLIRLAACSMVRSQRLDVPRVSFRPTANSSSWALRIPATGISWSSSARSMRSAARFTSSASTACSNGRWAGSCARSAESRSTAARARIWSARSSPSSTRMTISSWSSRPKEPARATTKWKTGFYQIALKAGVPIVCAGPDYPGKRGVFGPVIRPTGNYAEDMKPAFAFFRTLTPRHPERAAFPRAERLSRTTPRESSCAACEA